MVLLDTCTLLWLAADIKKLSAKAKKLILSSDGSVFVSTASAWEIAVKSRSGKLKFEMDPKDWFDGVVADYSIREIAIDSSIAFQASLLEPVHNDPFDRIIVATALLNRMTIVTCDELIARYRNVKVVW